MLSVGLLPVGDDWVRQSTHTDANGAFQFFSVEPGEYVLIARSGGFQSRALRVRALSGQEVDAGALELGISGCESPGVNCDTFGVPPTRRPPVPVVDLCEALKSPEPLRKQADSNGRRVHNSPWLADLDRDVRYRAYLGRPDLDQRSAPSRRSRSAAVPKVS